MTVNTRVIGKTINFVS